MAMVADRVCCGVCDGACMQVEDEALVNASRVFEQAKAANDYRGYCHARAEAATSGEDRQVRAAGRKDHMRPDRRPGAECSAVWCGVMWCQVWAVLQTVVDKDSKSQLNRFLGYEDKGLPSPPRALVRTDGRQQQEDTHTTSLQATQLFILPLPLPCLTSTSLALCSRSIPGLFASAPGAALVLVPSRRLLRLACASPAWPSPHVGHGPVQRRWARRGRGGGRGRLARRQGGLGPVALPAPQHHRRQARGRGRPGAVRRVRRGRGQDQGGAAVGRAGAGGGHGPGA